MTYRPSQLIEIKWAGKKGRGVFARTEIKKGTVIERVPVVAFPVAEIYGSPRQSKLAQYAFNWKGDTVAIALGYGSLYNHSIRPNAEFYSEGRLAQIFLAIRDIAAGEEITVYYGPEFRF
jgi:SET domain-containing protein